MSKAKKETDSGSRKLVDILEDHIEQLAIETGVPNPFDRIESVAC